MDGKVTEKVASSLNRALEIAKEKHSPDLDVPHLLKVCREVYGLRVNVTHISPIEVVFVLKHRTVLFAANRKYYGIAVSVSDVCSEEQVAVYEYSGNIGLFKKSDFALFKSKN